MPSISSKLHRHHVDFVLRCVLRVDRPDAVVHLQAEHELNPWKGCAVGLFFRRDVVCALERTLLLVQWGEDGPDLRRGNGPETEIFVQIFLRQTARGVVPPRAKLSWW